MLWRDFDASGKATQAKLLANYLDEQARNPTDTDGFRNSPKTCLRLAFPAYGTPIGKLIASKLKGEWDAARVQLDPEVPGAYEEYPDKEENALVLQSLMIANKMELAGEIERANMVEGRNVVLDRYIVSGIAYGQADGLDRALLETLHARLPKAHHILIDISVEESFKRRPKREDAYEADRARLERARKNYLAEFERNGVDLAYWNPKEVTQASADARTSPSGYAIVNGLGTVEEVHARVKMALEI